ncbi:MAG: TlpA family protein disulfide reductase [Firmicutes bacterium]|nr:TlpA family protein disulfide reductase [Bacillota bacterium]
MGNKKNLIILVLVFALIIGGASVLYTQLGKTVDADQLEHQETQHSETTEEKILAPDFGVYDKGGNKVFLSDFIGEPIVLNFWASWCGPCQMEMPDFNEKYLELGEDVNFLIVNMTDGSRETVEKASGFIDKKGYEFPVFYDTDMDAAETYMVYSLPTTYFIDSEGFLVAQATGAIDGETLQRGIDMIME